jgi:metallo-beta-lactamase class B
MFHCLLMSCLVVIPSGLLFAQQKPSSCAACAEWNRAQKPFRVFGNTYYVGPHGLSSILITSDRGHVLIDGALPESAEVIVGNIKSLGFRIEDVKLILNSHVHYDHAGGIAELQRLSGARVMASSWSAAVLRSGKPGHGDPQYQGGHSIAPVHNVHELHDGETFEVGNISITAHLTPGHTPGGTSWTWRSCEGQLCRNLVYEDSLSPVYSGDFHFTHSTEYPHVLEDFEKSFRFLESTPCDILITPHPDASGLWEHLAEREKGVTPDPMVNQDACRVLAEDSRLNLRQRLKEEGKQ